MERFLSELQRRKVLRVAAGYVVASWVILQVAGTLESTLNLPPWFDTIVFSILALGFPLALVVSWFFEFTPEGIKRTTTSGDGALMRPGTSDWILSGLLLLVLGAVIAMPMMMRQPVADSETPATPKEQTASVPGIPEASIAVLPFENLSDDKANAYFAAGVQDEILTRLSKIGTLKVISRTSTANLASRPDNLPDLARKLGVANILEGSVQKSGDTVRVNVQLIKAATDGHLWGEIYDRKLVDIFSVQSEIATAIAQTLNAKISGSEKKAIAFKPTENLEAYDAYLRALRNYRNGASISDFRNMERLLKEAVALDPNFALAWALLSDVNSSIYFKGDTTQERRAETRAALDNALRLQPDLPEVQLAAANHTRKMDLDFEAARLQLEQLLPRWPNNSEIPFSLAITTKRQGKWSDSKDYSRRAIELDPFFAPARDQLFIVQHFAREYRQALQTVEEGLAISPESDNLVWDKTNLLQSLGRLEEAEVLVAPLRSRPRQSMIGLVETQAALTRRDEAAVPSVKALIETAQAAGASAFETAHLNAKLGWLLQRARKEREAQEQFALVRDALEAEVKKQPNSHFIWNYLAWAYAALGEREKAFAAMERAVGILPAAKEPMFGVMMEESRAALWAYLGDHERAIPELARLLKAPGTLTPALLRLHPSYDKLRGDKRFEGLVREGAPLSVTPH